MPRTVMAAAQMMGRKSATLLLCATDAAQAHTLFILGYLLLMVALPELWVS
jgi:hypothetical protein